MTTSQATELYEMVTVPEPKHRQSEPSQVRLAVRSRDHEARFKIGGIGPEHLPVEKIYFTVADREFEIDFAAETLTVADKSRMRVTIFRIDVAEMQGHVIGHDETFTIVLADEARTERSMHVGRWVAATAPQDPQLIPKYATSTESIAVSISATTQEAERLGRVKIENFETTHTASVNAPLPIAASSTTTPVIVDLRENASAVSAAPLPATVPETIEDEASSIEDESIEVIVPDPITGARYKGREWRKHLAKAHELTLLQLRTQGFRVVILEMEHDRSATIALNDPNGFPVLSIMTNPNKPPIERLLTVETWDERFGPGTSLHFSVESMIDGSPAHEHGDMSTPAISRVTATAEPMRRAEVGRFEVTNTLAKHRKNVALQATHHRRQEPLVRIASR